MVHRYFLPSEASGEGTVFCQKGGHAGGRRLQCQLRGGVSGGGTLACTKARRRATGRGPGLKYGGRRRWVAAARRRRRPNRCNVPAADPTTGHATGTVQCPIDPLHTHIPRGAVLSGHDWLFPYQKGIPVCLGRNSGTLRCALALC